VEARVNVINETVWSRMQCEKKRGNYEPPTRMLLTGMWTSLTMYPMTPGCVREGCAGGVVVVVEVVEVD
jgi:hypothetical protein